LPHLGEHFGVRGLGRCADRLPRDRLRRRGRVRSVPVVAREQCSPGKATRKRMSACLTRSLRSVLQCNHARNFASASRERARADEVTPSARAASQVRSADTSVIASVAPHRNTFEIMRLFATYHSAHSRFTLRDTTASTMTAWKGGNIQSYAAAQITSDRACWGRTGGLPVGGLRPRVHRAALRSYCWPDRRIRPIVLSPAASAQTRGRSAELEAGRPRA